MRAARRALDTTGPVHIEFIWKRSGPPNELNHTRRADGALPAFARPRVNWRKRPWLQDLAARPNCIELRETKTGGRVSPSFATLRRYAEATSTRPWQCIRKRAELEDVRIHDLRHGFASRALALGESLMIGKLLGHTQVQTTARYAHLARDSMQTAASRIAESIGGNLMRIGAKSPAPSTHEGGLPYKG